MDFFDHFLTGIASHLDTAGAGSWSPDTGYTDNDIAIVKATLPQAPDRAIALNAFDVDNDPTLSDTTLGLQVRTRGPRDAVTGATAIGSTVFDVLHGSHDYRLPSAVAEVPGVWVVQCLLRSSVSGGVDGNRRWSYIQNFYVDVHRPSPNRT